MSGANLKDVHEFFCTVTFYHTFIVFVTGDEERPATDVNDDTLNVGFGVHGLLRC
jgi:hypothetical protein